MRDGAEALGHGVQFALVELGQRARLDQRRAGLDELVDGCDLGGVAGVADQQTGRDEQAVDRLVVGALAGFEGDRGEERAGQALELVHGRRESNLAAVDSLSQSPVWNVQRAFYEERASEAFAEIPHEAVDNPWVAAAYARVIAGFLRDSVLDPEQPLYVVELGAGAGRFAHGLTRELGERTTQDFVYVMTDFAESQLEGWEQNPALEDERFDFARFDLTQDRAPVLRRRHVTLENLANPLVVIANYVFDSVPADAFAVQDGVLEECLVEVLDELNLIYARRSVAPGHYGDPDLDALLEHYRTALDDTVFTLPRAALATLRNFRALANDQLLVLAADKALSTEEALGYREEPQPARHGGAFSLMVNFHALGHYARSHGGEMFHGGDRHAAIDVGAIVFGPSAETRAAYADAIDRFGPGDLAILSEGVERTADQLSVAEIVALLRLDRLGRVDAAQRARAPAGAGRRRRPGDPGGPPPRAVRDLRPPFRGPRRSRPAVRDRAVAVSSCRTTRTRSSSSRPRSSSTATIPPPRRTSSSARRCSAEGQRAAA